ncbi:hypothetical protein [Chitinophaga caseinilytica]|uniref:hypothetical protein n=1 Tax=Chitinophaga caseinilytica TaxID=2267521 RepID=UPI003C2FFDD3
MSKSWSVTVPSCPNGSATPLNTNPLTLTAGRADGSSLLLQGFVPLLNQANCAAQLVINEGGYTL